MTADNATGYKPFTDANFTELIKNYFEVPKFPGMYVLGCFARYATLYSQQVRALNLACGLDILGRIPSGTKVAVVGAGAAGLTVAAAMADLGCAVTILDEHASPLELQRNSRQRWIHPFIYDWPNLEKAGKRARLPLLDWSAGYADQVAIQIESDWNAFLKQLPSRNRVPVRSVFCVRGLEYSRVKRRHRLAWDEPREGSLFDTFDQIVLAVGFGLEPIEPGRNSYWEDDGIDAGFRSKTRSEPWLVTGGGDAGLIDLMRLCIKDFRHEDVIDYFLTLPGVANLADELSKNERGGLSDSELSQKLSARVCLLLENRLKNKLRNNAERTVKFATKDSNPYGRGSSLLNRIIVAALEHSSGFVHQPRKTKSVKFAYTRRNSMTPLYRVLYEKGPQRPAEFHRVVVRHGPDKAIDRFWQEHKFPSGPLDTLRKNWEDLYAENKADETKVRHWKPEQFSRAASENQPRKFSPVVDEAAEKQGFRIDTLTCSKQIREDGSSSIAFVIDGLEAVGRPLERLAFYLTSKSGNMGTPTLEQSAARLGLRWVPNQEILERPDSMEETLESIRSRSGFVQITDPLKEGDFSQSFSLNTVVLNEDALSAWEFEQLYPEGHRPRSREAYQSFTRIVSVPTETFKIRITLPQMGLGQPMVKRLIPSTDFALRMAGSFHSVPKDEAIAWPEAEIMERWEFSNLSAQTWELTVHSPKQGSCYSLQWRLPDLAPPRELVEESGDETRIVRNTFYRMLRIRETDSEALRKRLLLYRNARVSGRLDAKQERIRDLLLRTHAEAEAIIREPFELSLMTYDDEMHRLVFADRVEGASTSSGRSPRGGLWNYYLPYGIGLSGNCFRQADSVFFHVAGVIDRVDGEPAIYVPLPGGSSHRGMVVFPLWHSDIPNIVRPPEDNSSPKIRIDTSKQLLGVLDLGFMADSEWLHRARVAGPKILGFDLIRRNFSASLVKLLNE